ADILLLDSSFAHLVAAVAWGRNVYDSVTRFLQFQLTANMVAIAVAVGGAVCLRQSPLSAVQMLWVNLIIDSLASLALATDAPNADVLTTPPHRPTDPIVTPTVLKHILGQSAYQLAVLYGIVGMESAMQPDMLPFHGNDLLLPLLGSTPIGGSGLTSTCTTLVFNTFVWMQLFNQINC
ncbi:hypothetical protein Agub_g3715, partial [Astrephomene gubernaculifera]